jgi:uncharacterized protein
LLPQKADSREADFETPLPAKSFSMKKKDYKTITDRLKKINKRRLDDLFHDIHEEIFETFDCLACANCCKSIPPRLREADIRRIAAQLRIKAADFTAKYIIIDNDGDYVFSTSPCPFLEKDNYCRIYEYRPLACAEYPHTDRHRMHQILDLTAQNAKICPAVRLILDKIEKNNN